MEMESSIDLFKITDAWKAARKGRELETHAGNLSNQPDISDTDTFITVHRATLQNIVIAKATSRLPSL